MKNIIHKNTTVESSVQNPQFIDNVIDLDGVQTDASVDNKAIDLENFQASFSGNPGILRTECLQATKVTEDRSLVYYLRQHLAGIDRVGIYPLIEDKVINDN